MCPSCPSSLLPTKSLLQGSFSRNELHACQRNDSFSSVYPSSPHAEDPGDHCTQITLRSPPLHRSTRCFRPTSRRGRWANAAFRIPMGKEPPQAPTSPLACVSSFAISRLFLRHVLFFLLLYLRPELAPQTLTPRPCTPVEQSPYSSWRRRRG